MDDWENWFSDQDKELQQIYQGQSAMKDVLQDLHRKMDEIIGRQERTLSVISSVSSCAFSSRPQKISSIFGLAFFVGCRSGVIDRWCIWRRPASNTN
jgi:demethoxyubiquinone hydroxylase (CLK1/Coq7/Cat5 family)